MAENPSQPLNLKAGEWIEVRSREEILATLNESGRLENLPFMPEMFRFCGQRFRVSKRSDKTCDNIQAWSIRRMERAVHLDGARCDGAEHGGCQAGCLIFWKEEWLKRDGTSPEAARSGVSVGKHPVEGRPCTVRSVFAASQTGNQDGETIYSCQATELRNFTSYMPWWDPRQYIRDLRSGNLKNGVSGDSLSDRILELMLGVLQILRAFVISVFNDQRHLGYPSTSGTLVKTSAETLDLQPGEIVQVRSKEEIIATLDKQSRNRGLLFDGEMLPYCGGIYRVLRRVNRIIDEKTGKMMNMKHPCIVLEGVVCKADYHRLCPRAIYSYWRENWLRRVSSSALRGSQHEREVETFERS